jgi:hypothetical protein
MDQGVVLVGGDAIQRVSARDARSSHGSLQLGGARRQCRRAQMLERGYEGYVAKDEASVY